MSLCALCNTASGSLTVISPKLLEFLKIRRKQFKRNDKFCRGCINKIQRTYDKFWASYKANKGNTTNVQYSTTNSSEDSLAINNSNSSSNLIEVEQGTQSTGSISQPILGSLSLLSSSGQSHISVIDSQKPTTSTTVPGGNKRKRERPKLTVEPIVDTALDINSSSTDSIFQPITGIPQRRPNNNIDDDARTVPGPSNLDTVQPYVRRRTSAAIAHIDEREVPIYRRHITGG